MLELIKKLKTLERTKNGGRGVSCVRDVIMFLEKDRTEDARGVCRGDRDKIRLYQDIARLLVDAGLMERGMFTSDEKII